MPSAFSICGILPIIRMRLWSSLFSQNLYVWYFSWSCASTWSTSLSCGSREKRAGKDGACQITITSSGRGWGVEIACARKKRAPTFM